MPRTFSIARLAGGALATLALAGCAAAQSPSPSVSAPAASSAAPTSQASPAASASASAEASASGDASPSGSAAEADITVSGVDYAFEDMPDTVDAGTVLGFRNDGQEVHEMIVVRINDDVEETFEELLQNPEAALNSVQQVGFALASPGETAAETATVTEPGNYGMVCFIPTGTTSLPESTPEGSALPSGLGSGPPHFAQGMWHDFTVE